MKKYSLIPVIILIAFAVVPTILFAQAQNGFGTIIFIKGSCLVQTPGGEYTEARIGQPVFSSDRVKTLPESTAEISLPDGSTIHLTPDSEITVHRSALEKNTYTSVGLLFGSIRLFIQKLLPERQEFQVNTVSVTAGIRGTEFTASVREDGDVLIQVEQGEIETGTDGGQFVMHSGEASGFSLSGERKDYRGPVDVARWRKEAIRRIRQNPETVLTLMYAREQMIIERLKKDMPKLEEYKKNWVRFLQKAGYLEKHKHYRELDALIDREKVYTLKVLIYLTAVRRRLTIIRSILVLTAHIEKSLEPQQAKKMLTLQRIRAEYAKISLIIRRIDETEQKLKRVLFVLNRKQRQMQG